MYSNSKTHDDLFCSRHCRWDKPSGAWGPLSLGDPRGSVKQIASSTRRKDLKARAQRRALIHRKPGIMGREAPIIKNKKKHAVADFPVLGPITLLAHNIAIVRDATTTPFHAKRNAATRHTCYLCHLHVFPRLLNHTACVCEQLCKSSHTFPLRPHNRSLPSADGQIEKGLRLLSHWFETTPRSQITQTRWPAMLLFTVRS